MATVLFAWELGGGLGHMLQQLPLAEGLTKKGHRVFVALRNVAAAAGVFDRGNVAYLAAPCRASGRAFFRPTLNFAQILANVGWGRGKELFSLTCAWRNLMRLVKPDLVVFDHSPTALLASRGLPFRRALIGSGFFCPPDARPFPLLDARPPEPDQRPNAPGSAERVAAVEQEILDRANKVLGHWRQPPLERLGQLYSDVDEDFLATFPELDHYGARAGVKYWGPVNGPGGGKPVEWPEAKQNGAKRIYAYLKQSPGLPELFTALARRGHSTVVFCDGVDEATRERFASPALRFCDDRLDLAQVGRECDLAIHNGNHGTLSELLLAGRPMLQIPLTLEQNVLARVVRRTGAAELIDMRESTVTADDVGNTIDTMLADERYARAAHAFAEKYAGFDPAKQRLEMLRRAEELLATSRRTMTRAAPRPRVEVRQTQLSGLMQVTVPLSKRPMVTELSEPGSRPGTMGIFRG